MHMKLLNAGVTAFGDEQSLRPITSSEHGQVGGLQGRKDTQAV